MLPEPRYLCCRVRLQGRKSLDRNEKSTLANTGDSLRTRERETISRVPLVATYNPHTMLIAEVANRHWHFLQLKERLAHIFRERPLVASYRRPKSLRDTLVSTTLKRKTPDNHSGIREGCGPCNKPRCSWCNHINKASTFTGMRECKVFNILHSVDCQSSWVIYIIECNICKLQYVGKSEIPFNIRLNNHRNHIKKGVGSCELVEHFLYNTRTHSCENDVTITIIEEIKRDEMVMEKKREILRRRKYSGKDS